MKITRIEVNPVSAKSTRLKAYASVVFDDILIVKNLRVIEGRKGYFVAMPSKEKTRLCPVCSARTSYKDGFCRSCGKELSVIREAPRYKDIIHPLTTAFGDYIKNEVLNAYNKVVSSKKEEIKKSK